MYFAKQSNLFTLHNESDILLRMVEYKLKLRFSMKKKRICLQLWYYFLLLLINSSFAKDLENKYSYYNDMYSLLSVHYKYFLRKALSPDELFFNKLLSQDPQEALAPGNIQSKIKYKTTSELYTIINIIKSVFDNAKKKDLPDYLFQMYDAFIKKIEESLKEGHSIIYAFKSALYHVTGNDDFFAKLTKKSTKYILAEFKKEAFGKQSHNLFIITICWILYAYEKAFQNIKISEKHNLIINQDILFIFSYPLFISLIDKIYEKIRFNHTIYQCFANFLQTKEGFEYIESVEKYPKFINDNMAAFMVNEQRNTLIELLMDPQNQSECKEIAKYVGKVANYSHLMQLMLNGERSNNLLYKIFDVENVPVSSYLKSYVPLNFFYPFQGVHSSKFAYGLSSFFKFYEQTISFYANRTLEYWDNDSKHPPKESTILQNFYLKSLVPIIGIWPLKSLTDNEFSSNFRAYLSEENQKKPISLIPAKDMEDAIKESIWKNKDALTWGDTFYQYSHMPGLTGTIINWIPLLSGTISLVSHAWTTGINVMRGYHSIKSLLNQIRGMKNYYSYFSYLNSLILNTKKLLTALNTLYKKNNIPTERMLPEIINIEKLFNMKKKNGILQKIYQLSKSRYKFYGQTAINFFIPGLMSHFYFRELNENLEIDILNSFIGAIDFSLCKQKLLEINKINPALMFSTPHILSFQESPDIVFDIKEMWFPSLRGIPIKNSLSLDIHNKNIMLVGPVASGKTVFLSTILTVIYMAYMGIVPTTSSRFSYFDYIFGHMEHTYEIGSGISQHLAERASMKIVKEVAHNIPSHQRAIMIIDEIYKGTIPQLAVREATIDLPPILLKDNIITIITTHFPEITKIAKDPEYKMKLYYLLVDHVEGQFIRRHKLCLDDEHNWWLKDQDMAFEYQLYLDKK